jgi:tRNA-splicing ligase RtcB
MDLTRWKQRSETCFELERHGAMRVPALLYASEPLAREMDEKVALQLANVASLPGIATAAYAMPDAHWGYGFPIGGVAAFDAERGGVISAGGVGFDISCGVRCLLTGLRADAVSARRTELADRLFARIPAGVGSTGELTLDDDAMHAMLTRGARWAVDAGYGDAADLLRVEGGGQELHAKPSQVSARATLRQREEMGTLGSGNHYLELQRIGEIYEPDAARAFGLVAGEVVVSLHCGSRGLGHQIGSEFLREMAIRAPGFGISLPDRELACAPLDSELGQNYLGAMRAAINCALANRQILTHLAREVLRELWPGLALPLLYDVSHNTCKAERHATAQGTRELFVHRKGATRALGPGHPELPPELRATGQPVLIGGSMGTGSHVLVGTPTGEALCFASACHGAGRAMSRHAATRRWRGRRVVDDLRARGVEVRSPSLRGIAEEAPGAYKDVDAVAAVAEAAGLARRVARLEPLVCIKG